MAKKEKQKVSEEEVKVDYVEEPKDDEIEEFDEDDDFSDENRAVDKPDEDDSEDEDDSDDDIEEGLKKIFDGANISEETQEKLKVLFDAAVSYRVANKVKEIHENLVNENAIEIEKQKRELQESADAYVQYVVEEWTAKNKPAIQSQIKMQIFESFFSGLKNLFEEHNINIPDEQINMSEELAKKVKSLETDMQHILAKNSAVSKELAEARKQLVIMEEMKGMTELDSERLAEMLETKKLSDDIEVFKDEIKLIKESFFKKSNKHQKLDEKSNAKEKNGDAVVENKLINETLAILQQKFQ